MIYIVKTNDNRHWYLKQFLDTDFSTLYSSTYSNETNIEKIILPFDGVDQFAYIKHTNILLEKIILNNKIKEIYTGRVNNVLKRLCLKHQIKLLSFYENEKYIKNEFMVKIDIIKYFLEEKLNMRFSELRVIVVGDGYFSYMVSEKLGCDIYGKDNLSLKSVGEMDVDRYDAVINFSNMDLMVFGDKLVIDMNDIEDVDLSILLNCRKIYFINQLMTQYLTKSGAKLMYDCMVNR